MNGKRSPAGRPEECPVSDDHRRPDMGLDALWRLPLFSGLSRAFLEDLLGETKRIRVGRGTALFIQGERADRFYVLLRGWVKLYRIDDEGAETVLRVVAPGEAFAEAAMFASGRFPVCGQAAEDAELLVVPARALLDRLRADPELALRMLGTLSARMRYLVGRLDRAQTVSARRRLAEFLLRAAGPGAGAVTVRLPCDKALVAAQLGMKPETLSRSFARLRAMGVSTRGGTVTIADPAALRRYVGRDPL